MTRLVVFKSIPGATTIASGIILLGTREIFQKR
jgi:hypothetical protein